MKTLYVDKKERVRAFFTPTRALIVGIAALLILCAPIWPDFEEARFILQPSHTAVLRATVPGFVTGVLVQEGQTVDPGTPLLQLRNLELDSQVAQADQAVGEATARATQAALRYTDFAASEQERQRRAENKRLLTNKVSQLTIKSPIAGTVLTPHVTDLVGRSVDEGDLLVLLADGSEIRANVYLPEFAMRDVRVGQSVRLLIDGRWRPLSGTLKQIFPAAAGLPAELMHKDSLAGINPPQYYLGTVMLPNEGGLMPEMVGTAKVLVARRSLGAFCYRFGRDLVDRRVW